MEKIDNATDIEIKADVLQRVIEERKRELQSFRKSLALLQFSIIGGIFVCILFVVPQVLRFLLNDGKPEVYEWFTNVFNVVLVVSVLMLPLALFSFLVLNLGLPRNLGGGKSIWAARIANVVSLSLSGFAAYQCSVDMGSPKVLIFELGGCFFHLVSLGLLLMFLTPFCDFVGWPQKRDDINPLIIFCFGTVLAMIVVGVVLLVALTLKESNFAILGLFGCWAIVLAAAVTMEKYSKLVKDLRNALTSS